MHYMYPYEYHMVVMKGYVCNHSHPESSMIEGYTTEEVIECYTITSKMENQYVFQFHDSIVDSLGKESKEQNQSLMVLMKECVSHPVFKAKTRCSTVWMPRIKLSYIGSECKHRIPMSLLYHILL
jgi:hypothetical protein